MQALPVGTITGTLRSALSQHAGAVLQAPPGAGKTTLVPLALLGQAWLNGRKIIMLEPRRLAARAAADRMADLLGEPVGHTVGYRMRMERRVRPETRIEVVTEGILTRMLQSDAALTGVGLVIFDEFHERSLQADLGLTLCLEIQGVLNTGLRLLVMSATLETAAVASFMGNVPVIACRGRSHPVETRYGKPRRRREIESRVAATIRRAAAAHAASILVFLPGAAEIGRVARQLQRPGLGADWIVQPLFGRLTRAAQERAIAPAPKGRCKIVLASAIAETSLTIEGIRVVVDSGFMRVPRFDIRSGLTRLVTLPVTKASADQRRGRAGRTAPGICYRLWSEAEQTALVPHNPPEITVADMNRLALELALWGVRRPAELRWLEPPPPAAYDEACALLKTFGAIDHDGQVTAHGRCMAKLPAHPRLAHMLCMAKDRALGRTACDLAALLSERDFFFTGHRAPDADLQSRLDGLAALRDPNAEDADAIRTDQASAQRVRKAAALLYRKLGRPPEKPQRLAAGRLMAWAYPDRIAQRRTSGAGRFLLASGRGAYLKTGDLLAAREYIVAAELDGNPRDARIFLAAAYDGALLRRQFADRIDWQAHVAWDSQHQRVAAVRRCRYGELVLHTEPITNPDPDQVQAALLAGVRCHGLECLPWTRELRGWQARNEFLRRVMDGWPDFSDAGLTAELEKWLAPVISGITRLRNLQKIDLGKALRGRLDWRRREALDRLAPVRLQVPSGRAIPVDYRADPPVLAVRLQEMFGQSETPIVAGGRQRLVVHLLSPAGRPVQITQDLAGFWQSGYKEVRKSLRGRYPKHHWPEDPLSARATHRVRPRKT
jgi:ATP-dependent helicase HrpB